MKKITLLNLFLVLSIVVGNTQQSISFESSEGFSTGDLNGQNGWAVTGCGDGCFIENQMISDEQASDGSSSLKISPDLNFSNDQGVIFGGFYDLPTPVDYTNAVVSYDIYVTELGESDFRFGVTGEDGAGDLFFTFLVDFSFTGDIRIINAAGNALESISTWEINTWYNVRAEVTGSNVVYFIDNVQVQSSTLDAELDFTSIRFVHDNFSGDGYIDNIRINDEALSVTKFDQNSITHSYDKNLKILNLNSSSIALAQIEIFDILGKKIINKDLNRKEATINTSNINDGIYLAKVRTLQGIKTIKFLKN